MRIEELQNNLYIKQTDSVERYLLNIIQEYFRDSNETLEGSKEYIIREAVDRLKTEMDYNSLGVLSITLPDGRILTGDTNLTLEDLGGEPLISPKLSAFNVDFGTKAGTACEGNDPRLYDARKPIQHEHEISDIRGLEGLLSTITAQIDRADIFNHTHSNKNVLDKIIYTGSSDIIDLSLIDTLESKIDQVTEIIRQNITDYISQTDNKIDDINTELTDLTQRLDSIQEEVMTASSQQLTTAKQYTDTVFDTVSQELENHISSNYVKRSEVAAILNIARNCYTLVGSERWPLSDLYRETTDNDTIVELPFTQSTKDELIRRSIDIATSTDIIFELSFEYYKDGKTYKQPLPYLDNFSSTYEPYMFPILQQLTVAGHIQAIQNGNNTLRIDFKNTDSVLSSEMISTGVLVCDIYAKDISPI